MRNAMISSVGSRAGVVVGLLAVNAQLGRQLEPGGFGSYVLVVTIAQAGATVALAGTNRTILRELASRRARTVTPVPLDSLPSLLALTVPLALLLATGAVWTLSRQAQDRVTLTYLVAALTLGYAGAAVLSDALRATGGYLLADGLAGRSGGPLTLVSFGVILAASGAALATAGAVLAIQAVLLFAFVVLVAPTLLLRLPPKDERPSISSRGFKASSVRISIVFGLGQIATQLGTSLDLWLSPLFLDAQEVGLYAASKRLVMVTSLPIQAAQVATVAEIARLHAAGRDEAIQLTVRRAASFGGVVAAIPLIVVVVAPSTVLELVFGGGYRDGGNLVRLLAIGQAANVMSGLCGSLLNMMSHERTVSITYVVGLVALSSGALLAWSSGSSELLAATSGCTTAAVYAALWALALRRTGIDTRPRFRLAG